MYNVNACPLTGNESTDVVFTFSSGFEKVFSFHASQFALITLNEDSTICQGNNFHHNALIFKKEKKKKQLYHHGCSGHATLYSRLLAYAWVLKGVSLEQRACTHASLKEISGLWFIAPRCFCSLLGGSPLLEVLFVSWMANMPSSWLERGCWEGGLVSKLLQGGPSDCTSSFPYSCSRVTIPADFAGCLHEYHQRIFSRE